MSGCVMDASAVGPLVLRDEADTAHHGLERWLAEGAVLVPFHWRLEVANMLMVAVRRGRISATELRSGLDALAGLPITIDPATGDRCWTVTLELAERYQLSIYDAAYLELARRGAHRLATHDAALARAATHEGIALL